ncbi:MAG: metallopeptidase [Gammaproteobacteria bacterium]|nr:MAG: metallopeptidase [Gammaproteobacteria bacterium]
MHNANSSSTPMYYRRCCIEPIILSGGPHYRVIHFLAMPSLYLHKARFTKAGIFCVLLICGAVFSVCSHGANENKIQELNTSKAQLKKIDSAIESLQNWLKKAAIEKNAKVKALRDSELTVSKIDQQIQQLAIKQKKTQKQIKSLALTKKKQKTALQDKKRNLAALVLATYQSGSQPAIKLLLNLEDPRSIARNMSYLRYFSDAQKEQINQYNTELEKIVATEQAITEKRHQLATAKQKLQKQNKRLRSAIKTRQNALATLNKSINSKQARLSTHIANQQKLTSLIKQIEKTIASVELIDSNEPFTTQKSRLAWPVRGKITRNYKSQLAGSSLRSNGIFIETPESSPVSAVHYGRVVFADWLRGFGLLIIVDHGNNYMSLYGQNHSLLKDLGEWVNTGETIAFTGNSGGTPETGLYFEIRKKGKPQNPIKWLKKQARK